MLNKINCFIKKIRDFCGLEGYYFLKRIKAQYYIIIRSEGGAGFFSNYMWVLGHIVFARKLGYIPVVDMKNYPTLYSENAPINGIDNAWNYYFEDVDTVTLEQAYKSGRYVLGRDKYLTKYAEKYSLPNYRYPTEQMIDYYGDIINRNIRLRQELKTEYDLAWRCSVQPDDHVLGIHIRGTDMKNDLGHPMPASVETYLLYTRRMLKQYPEINKIFLATDENNVKEAYEKAFADNEGVLFMNEAFRVWDKGEKRKIGVHETKVINPRQNHKYLMGKEVLQDAWFLHRCDYLICGHSNVANVVMLWNQKQFKQVVCVDVQEEKVL
ncbi:MAG: hypothetical protein LUI12_11510 [Clostridiales bacterium]|nr:hypothetical protein [Clostridiales bacterium]